MATLNALNFIPSQISGLQLWLDATDLSSLSRTGDSVITWSDKSGNNKNFTATTGNPSLINDGGRYVLNFPSGVVMSSSSTISFTSTPFFFIVAKVSSISSAGISMLLSVGSDYSIRFNSSGLGGTPVSPGNTNDLGNSNYYITGNFNPNYALSVYTTNYNIIGTAVASNGGGTTTFTLSSTFLDRFFIGRIGEVILYPTLTVAQRQQVEGYLAWKWGIQTLLPSSHPYYYIPPNSAGLGIPSSLRISAPSQAFSPTTNTTAFVATTYSGLQVWFDGKDPNGNKTTPANGANISTLVDKSGNGRNATLITSVGSVTYNASTNAIVFNGGGSLNSSLSIGSTTSLTCFIVLSSSSLSAFRSALTINAYGGTRPNMLAVYQSSTNYIWFSGGTGGTDGNTNTTSIIANVGYVVANYWSPSSTQVNINGTSYNSSSSAPASLSANATLLIGSTVSGGTSLNEYWAGSVFEVLIYNVTLTTAQRQNVEGYLAWKWGLQNSLANSHPYKNTNPYPFQNVSFPTTCFFTPAAFSPKNISGLRVWLDGTDPNGTGIAPSNGATISTWSDKSGNANNATGGAATYQTNVMSTYPGITFSGSTAYSLVSPGSLSTGQSQGSSLFVIFKSTANKVDQGIFGQSPTNPGACDKTGRILYVDTTTSFLFGTMYCGFAGTSTTYTTNQIAIVSDIYTNTGVGNYTHTSFINGSNFNSTNATVTGANTSSFIAQVGSLNVGSTFFTGSIFEIIYYNTTITTQQRQSVEGYLAWKWGLQGNLSSTHPFKKFPPPPN